MWNSYIIKVARPQPICVLALNKQLNKLVGFKRCSLQTTVPQLMNTVMLRRLSCAILFLCMFFGLFFLFFFVCHIARWLIVTYFSRRVTSPLCNLRDPPAALPRLTCRYAMSIEQQISNGMNKRRCYLCILCGGDVNLSIQPPPPFRL